MSRLAILSALPAAAIALAGCSRANGTTARGTTARGTTARGTTASTTAGGTTAAADPRPASRLGAPERVRFAPQAVATGNLKAQQQAQLGFQVPGTLERILVRRGQAVGEGAPLAVLDSDLARASVAQGEAGLAAAQAQLRLAEDALARMTAIRKENGISDSQLVQAQAQRDLAAAQALGAKAQLEQARANLAHHTLRAPFAGVVTKVPDGTGVAVGAGTPLVTLESTRTLTLETSLTQEEAAGIRAGVPVVVAVPATGARTAEASVKLLVPSVDGATNRVPVEIAVPNPDGRFLPHAFARAQFPKGAERDALRVPSAALVQRDGGYALWIAAGDGRARQLTVKLLAEEGDAAVIEGALPAGARIVEVPPVGLSEGQLVAEAAR